MHHIKPREPSDEDEITPAVLHQILSKYHDGDPDPVQMRRVLLWFADLVDNLHDVTYSAAPGIPHREIPRAFFEYLREAVYRALRPKKSATAKGKRAGRSKVSADQALGIIPPSKRPKRSELDDFTIARAMLLRRLKGETWREGATYLQVKFNLSTKEIENIARVHIDEAIIAEHVIRSGEGRPFNIQEQKVIDRIEKKAIDRIAKKEMAIAKRELRELPVHPVFRKK